jgi:hypothetical protein
MSRNRIAIDGLGRKPVDEGLKILRGFDIPTIHKSVGIRSDVCTIGAYCFYECEFLCEVK